MGYRAEKLEIEGKIKVVKRVALGVVLVVLTGLCVFSAFMPADTWKYYVGKPEIDKRGEGELRIHFLDVGQGDSTLIELPDGKIVLIDGGNAQEENSTKILRYLNALKIDTIDHLVVSHADSDHCGGLKTVVENKKILTAYLPNTKPTVNAEYSEFYAAILKEGCQRVYSSRAVRIGSVFEAYPFTLAFLYPYSKDVFEDAETDTNESSSVVWLDYCGVSALFTGDAPLETENLLMQDDKLNVFDTVEVSLTDTEILKVSHHGSADSTSLDFLQYLGVETAVISCGKNNVYGHPSETVQTNLLAAGAKTYVTAEVGNVVVTVGQEGLYTVKTVLNK